MPEQTADATSTTSANHHKDPLLIRECAYLFSDLRRTSWPISRILFRTARCGGDHPSGHTVAGCLKRPTRKLGRAALERLRSRTWCGLLALLRVGFT